ncbi:hypothetical protein [Streptomyces sp. B1I3]|uniref:hypothetical protein n=1 Tax=Streptomyces sp. B1I3 TaxID=3042264 RepID=UPI00278AA9DD|nr:hypothetical protein [Streptomyces sp. B1I3]MDQ0792060.1 hypothetical protein [Streptomyces sp. B1I3]
MSIKSSAATNALTELTPERIAEIKDLLRYESSIAFYSHRAKESMLLLVAGVEQLKTERSEIEQQVRNEIAEDFVRQGKASNSLTWGTAHEIALNGLCGCSGGIKPCDMGGAS